VFFEEEEVKGFEMLPTNQKETAQGRQRTALERRKESKKIKITGNLEPYEGEVGFPSSWTGIYRANSEKTRKSPQP